MGQALSIPDSGTGLPNERARGGAQQLPSSRVAARVVLLAMIASGLTFGFLYQTQTESARLSLELSAERDAAAAYRADLGDGMTSAQLEVQKVSLDHLTGTPPPARFFLLDFQRMDFWTRQRHAYLALAQDLEASRLYLLTNLHEQVSANAIVASQVAEAWRQAGGTPADGDALATGTGRTSPPCQAAPAIPH